MCGRGLTRPSSRSIAVVMMYCLCFFVLSCRLVDVLSFLVPRSITSQYESRPSFGHAPAYDSMRNGVSENDLIPRLEVDMGSTVVS